MESNLQLPSVSLDVLRILRRPLIHLANVVLLLIVTLVQEPAVANAGPTSVDCGSSFTSPALIGNVVQTGIYSVTCVGQSSNGHLSIDRGGFTSLGLSQTYVTPTGFNTLFLIDTIEVRINLVNDNNRIVGDFADRRFTVLGELPATQFPITPVLTTLLNGPSGLPLLDAIRMHPNSGASFITPDLPSTLSSSTFTVAQKTEFKAIADGFGKAALVLDAVAYATNPLNLLQYSLEPTRAILERIAADWVPAIIKNSLPADANKLKLSVDIGATILSAIKAFADVALRTGSPLGDISIAADVLSLSLKAMELPLDWWAADPVDPNYKDVATGSSYTIDLTTVSDPAAKQLLMLAQSYLDAANDEALAIASLEKYFGAALAGDPTFMTLNQNLFSIYLVLADDALSNAALQSEQLIAGTSGAIIRDAFINLNDLSLAQNFLRANGDPNSFVDFLGNFEPTSFTVDQAAGFQTFLNFSPLPDESLLGELSLAGNLLRGNESNGGGPGAVSQPNSLVLVFCGLALLFIVLHWQRRETY